MRRCDGPDAGRSLIELVEIRGARLHRIERAAQHADDEIEPPVAIQVAGGGRVVAARPERRSRREGYPLAGEIGMRAGALVADAQESRLIEVTPRNVWVAIGSDVEHRHRGCG